MVLTVSVSGGELFDKIQEVEFYSEQDGSKILESMLRVILHCHNSGMALRLTGEIGWIALLFGSMLLNV